MTAGGAIAKGKEIRGETYPGGTGTPSFPTGPGLVGTEGVPGGGHLCPGREQQGHPAGGRDLRAGRKGSDKPRPAHRCAGVVGVEWLSETVPVGESMLGGWGGGRFCRGGEERRRRLRRSRHWAAPARRRLRYRCDFGAVQRRRKQREQAGKRQWDCGPLPTSAPPAHTTATQPEGFAGWGSKFPKVYVFLGGGVWERMQSPGGMGPDLGFAKNKGLGVWRQWKNTGRAVVGLGGTVPVASHCAGGCRVHPSL